MRTSAVTSVLFVGGKRTEALEAARNAGLRVVYTGPVSDMSERHRELVDAAVLLPEFSPRVAVRVAVALHGIVPFDLAYSAGDAYLQAAAQINQELGLRANPLRTVSSVNDKSLMREVLRGIPVGQVAAAQVESPLDLAEFTSANGFPVILKPRGGSASEDVHLISDQDGLTALAERLAFPGGGRGAAPWVVEEYLEGREFSVETHSAAGEHLILAVTEKFKNENFVEIGHVVPARITEEERAALAEETRSVLTALGVEEGPGHTELILTAAGPRLVETHTRPGGDAIVELVKLAAGYDIHEMTFSWLSGKPADVSHEPVAGAAAIWFLTAEQGRVTAVGGEAEAGAGEGVRFAGLSAAVGDTIPEVRGSADRQGEALAVGDDADSALRRARAAIGRLRVEVEPLTPAAAPDQG
ncbi:ATP-grasp domain-containing protein [Streptomyces palmae]|uniref:ATP-grasp domain-containing protein n=1 Tax=Streptomyces palmae TaxID=1701085 RepID=A0A4Z0H959_9ACTN|nr:ATP-grasp domain-containing protein [Streptomyces palmae]TGB06045.1 ATP-grasp domain-containing protein [Streptomyces palmae]